MKNDDNKQNVGDSGLIKINEVFLRDKIYTIRGKRVMLDYDLAEIYGYETKAFNRQVKNNIEKFEGEDFMFQLTRDEVVRCKKCTSRDSIAGIDMGVVRSHFVTSRKENLFKGQDGGSRYLPHAFTEQGIYMLMTVLRGELAIKQSRALVMTFKSMKDYIINNYDLTNRVLRLDGEMQDVKKKLDDVVLKSDLSPILRNFEEAKIKEEYVFTNGELAKASEVYIDICRLAENDITIIDNYINIKTLRHLQKVKKEIKITVISDNLGNYLHLGDYQDLCREFNFLKIDFIRNHGKFHDRFIMLDCDKDTRRLYHCGASIKDTGTRLSAIAEIEDESIKDAMSKVISEMLKNDKLRLAR